MLLCVWEEVYFRLKAADETMEFLSSSKCKNNIRNLPFLYIFIWYKAINMDENISFKLDAHHVKRKRGLQLNTVFTHIKHEQCKQCPYSLSKRVILCTIDVALDWCIGNVAYTVPSPRASDGSDNAPATVYCNTVSFVSINTRRWLHKQYSHRYSSVGIIVLYTTEE